VILVRHAEKVDESDDPDLSAKGRARAEALARILSRAGVDAIYVTQYKRTAQTAAPLARDRGVQPRVVNADASKELVRRLRADHAKDVVLVVGHSNTVPELIQGLGHPETITIPSDEYDGLYVVVPRADGSPSVLRLGY
jgi:broad specificity phosphatase PhoE